MCDRKPGCWSFCFSVEKKWLKRQNRVIFFERILNIFALSSTVSAALIHVHSEHVYRSYLVHTVYIIL